MRQRIALLVAPLLLLAMLPGAVAAAPHRDAKAEHRAAVLAYWTPARMKAAKPLDITFDAVRGFHAEKGKPGGGGGGGGTPPPTQRHGRVLERWRQDADHDRARAVPPEQRRLHLLRLRRRRRRRDRQPRDRPDRRPLRDREHGGHVRLQLAVHPVVRHGPDVHLLGHDVRLLGRRRALREHRRSPRPAASTTPRPGTTGASRGSRRAIATAASSTRRSARSRSRSAPCRAARCSAPSAIRRRLRTTAATSSTAAVRCRSTRSTAMQRTG